MKKAFLYFAISGCLHWGAKAQPVIKLTPCEDVRLQKQADSVKAEMSKNGFITVKEASVEMESEFELPVIVPFNQGTWYQIVFIGNPESRLFELRMYDWEENMVAYHKQLKKDVNGNVISFTYIPYLTGYHMIKTLQLNKKQKKGLCGYILLMKKVS